MAEAKKYLWKAQEIASRGRPFTQQLNPDSRLILTGLSRLSGLKRVPVSLARLPPGKDSFAYHAHRFEEEWLYILSGRGIAEIDGQSEEVGPGDFMGFPAPQVPHLLSNPYDEELVYLMGGEDVAADIIDYPKLGKRYLLVPVKGGSEFYELTDPLRLFGPADEQK